MSVLQPSRTINRRRFIAGLGAFGILGAARPWLRAADERKTVSLIRDPHFQDGATVYQSFPIARKSVGEIGTKPEGSAPSWEIAQWYSRNNLAAAPVQKLLSGSVSYFDGSETVVFGASGTEEADLTLGVDGIAEYGGKLRAAADPWPHLLFCQRLLTHPRLDTLAAMPYHVGYRLFHSETQRPPGWNMNLHAAHVHQSLTIMNVNPASPGFHDYYWFQVPLYDSRYLFPPKFAAKDKGSAKKQATDKYIYAPASEVFFSSPLSDGKWHDISTDLLPLLHEGLEAAWSAGFLSGSQNSADYAPQETTLGWEVSGLVNAAIQVRDLAINAEAKG